MAHNAPDKITAQSPIPEKRPTVPTKALEKQITEPLDARTANRNKFGRSISLDVIERATTSAANGSMRDITDLSRETIDTDPHLASVLQKRFGAVSSLPFEVRPATGQEIDKDLAGQYALVVREQLAQLENFRNVIDRIAWGLFDGRTAQEIKWKPTALPLKTDAGPVSMYISAIDWIHPRRLSFGPNREMRITDDSQSVSGNFSPIGLSLKKEDLIEAGLYRKFVQWNPQLFNEYPEREGLSPRCLYWSFFKRFSARDRMILTELFGKPWRIANVDMDAQVSEDHLTDLDNQLDGLGNNYWARLPRGVSVDVIQPGTNAGVVHQSIIDDSDKQMSKLVLGQTGTTDGVPAGLNSNQASVMQDEQLMILQRDAVQISEVIETQITDAIIELNFGADQLPLAPKFVLRFDVPADRTTDIQRLQASLEAGLEISRNEAYEISGFRIPERDEPIVRMDQPPTPPLSPVSPPRAPMIVYPQAEAPPQVEIAAPAATPSSAEGTSGDDRAQVGSSDKPTVITVNEARKAEGLEPLLLPDGTEDPDGNLTIAEYEAIRVNNATPEAEEDSDVELMISKIDESIRGEVRSALLESSRRPHENESICVCLQSVSDHEQPASPNGNPEDMISKGKRGMLRASNEWAAEFSKAVSGLTNPNEIASALVRTYEDLETNNYARALERRMVQATALGAVDVATEIGDIPLNDEKTTASKQINLTFSSKSFADAMKEFRAKGIVTKAEFNQMEAELKRRSFTVAGIESRAMLGVIMEDLSSEIATGADLRGFKKSMLAKLKSAGFIGAITKKGLLGASHVETVFRTNVLNSYNAGRYKYQSKPSVVRRFPVWEAVAITDPRARDTHRAINGVRLLANDPFWKTAYPPYGFNCRCRVVSRGVAERSTVVSGSTIRGLPDPGFVSGTPSLI